MLTGKGINAKWNKANKKPFYFYKSNEWNGTERLNI